MIGLNLDLIPGWLFTISALRIKSQTIRNKVILYQRECYKVLSQHFLGKRESRLGTSDSPAGARTKMTTETRLSDLVSLLPNAAYLLVISLL